MKIICVGKNYTKHIEEMGSSTPKEPVLFLKPDSALIPKNHPFIMPHFSDDVHHEIELVIKINRLGKHIQEKYAHKYYEEIALGIDFTARDKQTDLKAEGLPWEKSKAFDFSAFVSPFVYKSEVSLDSVSFRLKRNGIQVQEGNSSHMLYKIDSLISHISEYFTLKIGDLIFTGTPHGVGLVVEGDTLEGFLENRKMFSLNVI